MILVIDLGTSYFKTSLLDRTGRLLGVCRLQTPIRPSGDGLVEIDPPAFEQTIDEGLNGIRRECGPLEQVQAITFATQTNSIVLLDADDRPLTPLVLWPDRRAADMEDEVRQRSALPDFRRTTGIPALSYQFMVARLLWFQKHAPDVWAKLRRLSLISDYLTLLFCGRHVTEAGAAGLTGLVDIHRLAWWPAMLQSFAVDAACLPEIVRAGTDLGPIAPAAAKRFGLPGRCRMVVGCLDQYAGAIGAGNFECGSVSETTGTVLATVRCTDRFTTDLPPEVFVGPAFADGLYYQMVFGELSANYLEWYRDQLADRPSFEELSRLAEQSPPGAGGLRLRAGVPLTRLEEVFEGLSDPGRRGDAVRCIMESVAFALRDQIHVVAGDQWPPAVHCAGGAARSDVWLRIKADVLGMATMTTQCPEPVSQGAGVLAEAALGGHPVAKVAREWIRFAQPHAPDSRNNSLYKSMPPF